jgi:hypothetical protein
VRPLRAELSDDTASGQAVVTRTDLLDHLTKVMS